MTEINNNNRNYDATIRKITPKNQPEKIEIVEEQLSKPEQVYVEDTGVLGRSLVKKSNGGNMAKSIEEAVFIAVNNPEILKGGEEFFNAAENHFKEQGMTEEDAYFAAIMAQEEFTELANAVVNNR